MKTIYQDLRYAVRNLLKHPGFAIVVIATLAVGIGANTAIFSVVNGVLLRPLPYPNADRLVNIWGNYDALKIERLPAKAAEFDDYARQTKVFDAVAAYASRSFNIRTTGEPERIQGAEVSANTFALLETSPVVGRVFTVEEQQVGRPAIAVISYALWQRQFGGAAGILNQQVTLDDESYTVVGVMPREFQFPHPSFSWSKPAEIWIPTVFAPEQIAERRGPYYLNVLARLAPGVELDQARTEMKLLGQRFESEFRGYRGPNGEPGGWRIAVAPVHEEIVGKSRPALLMLSVAVGLLLLIACANVANLLLMRAAKRSRELAIRAALGASRWRLVRQLLVEGALLTVVSGVIGLLLVRWSIDLLTAVGSAVLPRAAEVSIDARVLGFTALISSVVTVAFALVPFQRLAKVDLLKSLKERTAGTALSTKHWSSLLVVSEVALSLLLLVGASLLVQSLWRLRGVDSGLRSDQLTSVEIDLSASRYKDAKQAGTFYLDLVGRLQSMPGVDAASFSTRQPLAGTGNSDPFAIEGRPLDPANLTAAGWQVVGPNYFRTMGTSVVKGRDFTTQDFGSGATPVALINEKMAARYWANEDPIGRRVTLGLPRADNPWITIIGVAKDTPHGALDSPSAPDWYLSRSVAPQRHAYVFVRSGLPESVLTAQIRREIASVDPYQPLSGVTSMNEVIDTTTAPRRFNTVVLTAFAAIALLLATLGIYSVISYSVALRTHEIGIRLALGAERGSILRMVLWKGMLLALVGAVIGLVASLAFARLLAGLLFGISPVDPATYLLVFFLAMATATLATVIPAVRATRVDPLLTLRVE
jgi:putative ABC transport system permease protein